MQGTGCSKGMSKSAHGKQYQEQTDRTHFSNSTAHMTGTRVVLMKSVTRDMSIWFKPLMIKGLSAPGFMLLRNGRLCSRIC